MYPKIKGYDARHRVASAAGTVAGSIAVAASFGGESFYTVIYMGFF